MKKNIFYIILGGLLFTTASVLAYNLSSNEVFYKKENNQDITVKQALDDLYTKIDSTSGCPSGNICISNDDFGTPTSYAFGDPDDKVPTEVGMHNVYIGKYDDGQLGVCITRNDTGARHCFRYNNWFAEREHLQQAFSDQDSMCNIYSGNVRCQASNFDCYVYSAGNVSCTNHGNNYSCSISNDGSVNCHE